MFVLCLWTFNRKINADCCSFLDVHKLVVHAELDHPYDEQTELAVSNTGSVLKVSKIRKGHQSDLFAAIFIG